VGEEDQETSAMGSRRPSKVRISVAGAPESVTMDAGGRRSKRAQSRGRRGRSRWVIWDTYVA
jgi:hypothetical protein